MEADILLLMGQSNMAGRGDYRLAPEVLPGAAYEYRAVTEPDTLVPLTEPFGVNENREGGVFEPGMKTGSMAAAFVNACYRKTGRPIIAVSCSKGGSRIQEWQPETPYFKDAAARYQACLSFVQSRQIAVHSTGMVWCQGCTNADDGMAKAEYKEKTMAFFQAVKSLGVDKIFLIQIGNHREFPDRYVPMQEAQEEIAEEMEVVIMTSRLFRTFRDRGLMKDSFHYKQEAYNLVGEEAGARTGEILTKEAGKTKL